MSQAGLAETGRTVKKHVVQGFITAFGRVDSYLEVILRLVLSRKLRQMPRPQAGIKRRILGAGFPRYDASYFVSPPG